MFLFCDLMLSDKYAPTTINGIIGNSECVSRLFEFAQAIHANAKPKPIMLFGPSGTGKTSAAHALAYGNGFELLELNASDYRDTLTLEKTLLPASRSKGLFNKNILILLDEIDEVSKKLDSGENDEWLEVGGSGIIRREVTGISRKKISVLAWGLGLERMFLVNDTSIKSITELYNSSVGWLRNRKLRYNNA